MPVTFPPGDGASVSVPKVPLSQRVVTTAADFVPVDPSVVYVVDGMVDVTGTEILVPEEGIKIAGAGLGSFDVAGLTTTGDGAAMFRTDPAGSFAGPVFISAGLELTASGVGSVVFDLDNAGNFNAIELNSVNFNGCTSLGTLNGYRQMLGRNLGLFGCADGLEFAGTWAGGARIETSIVRGFGSSGTLFKQGAGLSFGSRFLTDINCDLPVGALFTDFDASIFGDGAFELVAINLTRAGAIVDDDAGFMPNVSRSDLCSAWSSCRGISSTFPGGRVEWTSEVVTPLTLNVPARALGATSGLKLQHFDQPQSNRLRYLSSERRDFVARGSFRVEGQQGAELVLSLRHWDDSAGAFTAEPIWERQTRVDAQSGALDFARFTIVSADVRLDENDYIEVWLTNVTNGQDATVFTDSELVLTTP